MSGFCSRDAESRAQSMDAEREGPKIRVAPQTPAQLGLALIALTFALYAGAAFFIPLFVSLFMSYGLSPLVDGMERWRVPRAIAAAMTVLLVIAIASFGVQQVLNGATDVLEEMPRAVQKLRNAVTSWERDGTCMNEFSISCVTALYRQLPRSMAVGLQ